MPITNSILLLIVMPKLFYKFHGHCLAGFIKHLLEKLQITLSPGKFIKPKDPSAKLRELEERIRILDTEQIKSEERIKAVEILP